MKPPADSRLYAFVDTAYLGGRDPAELTRQLCAGGADLIQLRAKGIPVDAAKRIAEKILPLTTAAGVGLVINDHPELARAVGAPVAHLGQEDLEARCAARAANPADALTELRGADGALRIGLSTHAPEQALRSLEARPDYIAIGPVFATPTKPGRPAVTLDYVRWAAANVSIPWFAIGGITLQNLDAVLAAGATRICVVSAILRAPDVARACREFRARLG